MDTTRLLLISLLLVSIIIVLVFYISKEKEKRAQKEIKDLQLLLSDTQIELSDTKAENTALHSQLHRSASEYKLATQKLNLLQERHEEVKDNELKLNEKFELLASKILDQKIDKFDVQHRQGIKTLLDPLKEKISAFENKVELTHKESLEKHTMLQTQIKHLSELNEKVTLEANNLAKALKGDNKVQGNWGEVILASILEKSGLEKNREYFVQESRPSDNGNTYRPDVTIKLPDNRIIIIDSKVSLKAYESLVNAVDPQDQQQYRKAHYLSVKTHVDGLSSKNYHTLYSQESPDFVLMFIPIDTAFSSAIQYDNGLYAYAFDKNIVIVTPSTLLATLKTIDTLWNNEKQQRYAIDIANEAGKMYDKLKLFIDDMQAIGTRLDQSKSTYDAAINKLTSGRGNLISRAEKIKRLGAKANKKIDRSIISIAEEE